jgi:ribose transport system permease protein
LSAALGLAYVLSSGVNIAVSATSLTDFGLYTRIAGVPALPLLALVIVAIGGVVLHYTRFGRYTYGRLARTRKPPNGSVSVSTGT